MCYFVSTRNIDKKLLKFWELEEHEMENLSAKEITVEDYFQVTTKSGSDGKFVVRLPIKQPTDILGESKHIV